jgi:hypothetical protein
MGVIKIYKIYMSLKNFFNNWLQIYSIILAGVICSPLLDVLKFYIMVLKTDAHLGVSIKKENLISS